MPVAVELKCEEHLLKLMRIVSQVTRLVGVVAGRHLVGKGCIAPTVQKAAVASTRARKETYKKVDLFLKSVALNSQ